jgi:hypothetical protein
LESAWVYGVFRDHKQNTTLPFTVPGRAELDHPVQVSVFIYVKTVMNPQSIINQMMGYIWISRYFVIQVLEQPLSPIP